MATISPDLVAGLLAVAAQLSGLNLPPDGSLPTVEALPDAVLADRVCPRDPAACAQLVAHTDTAGQRIGLRASLDLDQAVGRSFLLHELVHWLEAQRPDAPDPLRSAHCETLLAAERRAYRVQNLYLRRQGRPERFGDMLGHLVCDPQAPAQSGLARLIPQPGSPNGALMLERFLDELREEEAAAALARGATEPPPGPPRP